jgi:hypothetical protein
VHAIERQFILVVKNIAISVDRKNDRAALARFLSRGLRLEQFNAGLFHKGGGHDEERSA